MDDLTGMGNKKDGVCAKSRRIFRMGGIVNWVSREIIVAFFHFEAQGPQLAAIGGISISDSGGEAMSVLYVKVFFLFSL